MYTCTTYVVLDIYTYFKYVSNPLLCVYIYTYIQTHNTRFLLEDTYIYIYIYTIKSKIWLQQSTHGNTYTYTLNFNWSIVNTIMPSVVYR